MYASSWNNSRLFKTTRELKLEKFPQGCPQIPEAATNQRPNPPINHDTLRPPVSELRSCAKEKVAVLGSPSLTVLRAYVDVKQHGTNVDLFSELRSCVKVEAAVLGCPSLIVRVASVDVKQH